MARCRWLKIFALSVAGLVFLSCATIDPKPFEKFHMSTSEFQAGADGVLESAYELAKAGFRKPSPFGDDVTFSSVVLTFDDDPTRPTMEAAPLYIQLRDLRRGTLDLNGAFAAYTQFLALLAGGSESDAEALEELAKTANANLRSARDAIKLDVGDDKLALFATLGTELLRQKIEHDRRRFLCETMDEASPRIDEFAGLMVDTMNLAAIDVMFTYAEWAELQRAAYDEMSRPEQKREIIIDVLERNDRTLLLLESLRTLRAGYGNFLAAHREVRNSIDKKEAFLGSVKRLYSDARRLDRLRTELAKSESK